MSRFIRLLEKEDDSSYIIWIQSPPPPLPREAWKLLRFIELLEKEDDSLYCSRILILHTEKKVFLGSETNLEK